jgi:hypothetical protein
MGGGVVNQRGGIWKRAGWFVTPSNSREVMSVIGAIGVYSVGQRFGWRGMSSADYRVTSSIHRRLGENLDEEAIRAAELDLLLGARMWGLGFGDTAFVDDLELLADMQHYGIETRLLDFSSNPMTALWFACQKPSFGVSQSGVLLALNVTGWPSYASVGAGNTWGHITNPNGSTLDQALNTRNPFLVESSHPNNRLRSQEGFFAASAVPASSPLSRALKTPFWSIEVPFSQGDPDDLRDRLTADRVRGGPSRLPFVAVIINASLKTKLRAYLENTFNRSAKVLFPDFAGYADFAAHGGRGGKVGAVAPGLNLNK